MVTELEKEKTTTIRMRCWMSIKHRNASNGYSMESNIYQVEPLITTQSQTTFLK